MPTSTRFAVATHTLVCMAVNEGSVMSSERLAFSCSTNPAVIRALLAKLSKAGLTRAQLGVGGGSQLTKPANDITLLEVFKLFEAPDLFAKHRDGPNQDCVVGKHIQASLLPKLNAAQKAAEAELAQVTVADLAADIAARGNFEIPWRD